MLKEDFRKIEKRLLVEIKSFYKKRLVSVVLFGSAARETQRFDSDIDVLIIAEKLPRGRMKRIREFDAIEEKIEPYLKSFQRQGINTYLSAIIKSPEESRMGSPLFLDMVEDAQILYDRGDFFSSVLERLRNRLKELGSKRVWKGNAWYWVLKPDYKPGEIFEL